MWTGHGSIRMPGVAEVAESASVAFGRYLRTLRERRSLSLDKVCRLSEASPKSLDKGTLSRFERGQQRLAVQSLIPLSKIYAISSEALLERLALDEELERFGTIDTEGLDYSELQRKGQRALHRESRKWDAYACFRDALAAVESATAGNGDDVDGRRRAEAWMNLATVARSLGKNHFALHELEQLARSGLAAPRMQALVQDRISNCQRCLGDLDAAARSAAAAVEQASRHGEGRILAYALFSRASVAIERSDHARAVEFLQEAYRAHREAERQSCLLTPNPSFEVSVLLHLAESYFETGAYDKSRRSALAAKRLSRRADLHAGFAYSELALGLVDEQEGRHGRARQRWKRTGESAEAVNNKRLAFAAEFYTFRQALALGMTSLARASQRRLERLEPWVPEHLPLLREYRELIEQWKPDETDSAPAAARGRRRWEASRGRSRERRPRP